MESVENVPRMLKPQMPDIRAKTRLVHEDGKLTVTCVLSTTYGTSEASGRMVSVVHDVTDSITADTLAKLTELLAAIERQTAGRYGMQLYASGFVAMRVANDLGEEL